MQIINNDDDTTTAETEEYIKYLYNNEAKYLPDSDYMLTQKELSCTMRALVIDWLIDVHHKFLFKNNNTIHLAVNIFDRILSKKTVAKTKLQLVGLASLFIAAKYEESYTPCAVEYINVCNNAYAQSDLIKMERLILEEVKYCVTVTTALTFADYYARNMSDETKVIVHYLCETSLLFIESLLFTPSVIACSAIWIVNSSEEEKKEEVVVVLALKPFPELEECIQFMLHCVNDIKRMKLITAVRKKYASKRRYEVSTKWEPLPFCRNSKYDTIKTEKCN